MVKSKNEKSAVLSISAKLPVAQTKLSCTVSIPPPQAGPDDSQSSDKFSLISRKAHPGIFKHSHIFLQLKIFFADIPVVFQELLSCANPTNYVDTDQCQPVNKYTDPQS